MALQCNTNCKYAPGSSLKTESTDGLNWRTCSMNYCT